jgi:hypothetical protein
MRSGGSVGVRGELGREFAPNLLADPLAVGMARELLVDLATEVLEAPGPAPAADLADVDSGHLRQRTRRALRQPRRLAGGVLRYVQRGGGALDGGPLLRRYIGAVELVEEPERASSAVVDRGNTRRAGLDRVLLSEATSQLMEDLAAQGALRLVEAGGIELLDAPERTTPFLGCRPLQNFERRHGEERTP